MALELITDRTEADVYRWQKLRDKGYSAMTDAERAEWDAGLKGAYKPSDLNRVGAALNYLLVRISEAGYLSPTAFTAKTNWTDSDIPTSSEILKYLSYVESVRAAIGQLMATPTTPKGPALDFNDANDIEKILVNTEKLLESIIATVKYCGELYSGEVRT